jgi:cell cycle arrest protein BUB3
MDGSIRLFEMGALTPLLVGRHESASSESVACSCVASLGGSSGGSQLIASAGWHKQLHIWDTRQHDAVSTVDLPGKAFAMDVSSNRNLMAIATSGRRTCFVDVRYQPRGGAVDGADLVLDRESSLKFQTRCCKFFPDGNAIAVGSIEGRVAVEYLDELGREANNKKFAFKCHRQGDLVYPVNCIEFHPRFGTFATGGCDGTVGKFLHYYVLYFFCFVSRPFGPSHGILH